MERHSAIFPTARPTEKLTPTALELDFLDLAQRHKLLPSLYFYRHFKKSEYARKVLRKLFKAHAVGLPLGHNEQGLSDDAWRYAKQRNVFYPVQLWPIGEAHLAKAGRWLERDKGHSTEWAHSLYCGVLSYSFESAPLPFGIQLRTQADILAHERCPAATRALQSPHHIVFNPNRKKGEAKDGVVPDHELFGYAYTRPGGRTSYVYFHGFEADRNTEQFSVIRNKLHQYNRYFATEYYKSHYGLTNVGILFITTNERRATGILQLIKEVIHPDFQQNFLVKVVPDPLKKYPPATAHMIIEPWQTVDGELSILNLLGADNGNQREGAQSLRAGAEN